MDRRSKNPAIENASISPLDSRNLASDFLLTCERAPLRTAVVEHARRWTYAELRDRASALAAAVPEAVDDRPLIAICGGRSATTAAAVLAALGRGGGWVTLSRADPVTRNREILRRTGCRTLILDELGTPLAARLLAGANEPLTVIVPAEADRQELAGHFPDHDFIVVSNLKPVPNWNAAPVTETTVACVLYPPGDAAEPRGVAVSHLNVLHMLAAAEARYGSLSDARIGWMSELAVDLSVFEMFMSWRSGAELHAPSPKDALLGLPFARERRLSVWLLAPARARYMRDLRLVEPGALPDLELTLFCGEPLSAELAAIWFEAAPGSIIEALYGSAEVTISCCAARFDPQARGVAALPLGDTLDGVRALFEGRAPAELLIGGPQVALGYWDEPEETSVAFDTADTGTRWFRTGDRFARGDDGALFWIGRDDRRVYVRGYPVDLHDVEGALRRVTRNAEVVAMLLPADDANELVAFVECRELDSRSVRARLRESLPRFMIPTRLHAMKEIPRTANASPDNAALARSLRRSD